MTYRAWARPHGAPALGVEVGLSALQPAPAAPHAAARGGPGARYRASAARRVGDGAQREVSEVSVWSGTFWDGA